MNDPLGAFCRPNPVSRAGSESGPLEGLTFAAKDVFDIAGTPTGFGQPDWLRTHGPASTTASAVQCLLDSGADLAGRTISDELCYSLSGENTHYGTPLNPRAPGRIPGGSSSGSASATAGGLVDFAIGTDCGGSVRIPASYCGLYGIRTTHGRVASDGVIPFAGTFDVIGWFARSPDLMRTVGGLLLDSAADFTRPRRLLVAPALFARADASVRAALLAELPRVAALFPEVAELNEPFADLDAWRVVFQTVQASEIWANHGGWITATAPSFGPGIKDRLAAAATITQERAAAARAEMARIRSFIRGLLAPGDVLCLPTALRIAPLRDSPTSEVEVSYRNQAMALLCIAGLGGLPQVSMPVAEVEGAPAGLSLLGSVGADEVLMQHLV